MPRDSDRGYAIVSVAFLMLILLIIIGFVTDGGSWVSQARNQQRAADLAALSGIDVASEAFYTFDESFPAPWSPLEAETRTRLALDAAIPEVLASLRNNNIPVSGSPSITTTNGLPSLSTITDGDLLIGLTMTLSGELTVDVRGPADQYFSQLAIDAPSIGRTATATLSLCGARCNQPIELQPPFTAPNAAGSGDGYTPIVAGSRVFAVNHHIGPNSDGLVCIDTVSRMPCSDFGDPAGSTPTYPKPLIVHTLNSMQHVHDAPNNRFYFVGTANSLTTTTMVCFDYSLDDYCGTVALWDQGLVSGSSNNGRGNGPVFIGGRLYAATDDGRMHCVQPDVTAATNSLSLCSGYPQDSGILAAAGNTISDVYNYNPAAFPFGGRGSIHIKEVGTRVYVKIHVGPHPSELTVLTCWDTATAATCAGWTQEAIEFDTAGAGVQPRTSLLFLRYDTGGNPSGICIAGPEDHRCYDLDNGLAQLPIPNFDAHLYPGGMVGELESGFTWENERSYFTRYGLSLTYCWDWSTASGCGVDDRSSGGPAGEEIRQYDFAVFTDSCIIGFGDHSIFYTFNPDFDPCLDQEVSILLEPCTCLDSTSVWGELILPADLLTVTTSASATVTRSDGTLVAGPQDLFSNLTIDLSSTPATTTELFLELDYVAALDFGGNLSWDATLEARLERPSRATLVE